jgi:putative Holliday junction resolvase
MPRIIAIDYGKKRTGIAVTDDFQIIASGLTTVETPQVFKFLTDYFKTEKVFKALIGLPKQMNGNLSESAADIEVFVSKFHDLFPEIEVVRVDERFTSKIAFQSMIDSGMKKSKRRNKAIIDEIAATIMLQDYLVRFKIV